MYDIIHAIYAPTKVGSHHIEHVIITETEV